MDNESGTAKNSRLRKKEENKQILLECRTFQASTNSQLHHDISSLRAQLILANFLNLTPPEAP